MGSQVARALTAATASGITCALIETATVNGTEISAGSGIYQTSVSGIGVSFYVVNGASQTLITSTGGGYTSGTISAPGNGALPGIQANLVVTGQVVSGYSLSGLPSVTVTFTPTGSCGWSTGITNTLATSASNSAVVPITCTVTTPSVSVNLPVGIAERLERGRQDGRRHALPHRLELRVGRQCLYHPERCHDTRQHILTAHACLELDGSGHQTENPEQRRTGAISDPIRPRPARPINGFWAPRAASTAFRSRCSTIATTPTPSGTAPAALSAGSVHAQATFTMSYQ